MLTSGVETRSSSLWENQKNCYPITRKRHNCPSIVDVLHKRVAGPLRSLPLLNQVNRAPVLVSKKCTSSCLMPKEIVEPFATAGGFSVLAMNSTFDSVSR